MTVEDRARAQPGVRRGISRVSRRVWDDALAWQSFVFVGRGGRIVRAKVVGYTLLALVGWQAVRMDYEIVPMLMLPVLCGGLLMNAINKPGECLTREFNDKTISTLLLIAAGGIALIAWRGRRPHQSSLSYWDLAGAVTFVGIAAALMSDPDQALPLFEASRSATSK